MSLKGEGERAAGCVCTFVKKGGETRKVSPMKEMIQFEASPSWEEL